MTTEHIISQEHVTLTEEVQKDGQVVTVTRETLQSTVETPEDIKGKQAYGVTHPGYISAQDRVYTYNEETGMSESEVRDVNPTEEELPEDQPVTQEEIDEEEELDEEEEPIDEIPFATPEACAHPVGNGECVLEAGHSGAHRLTL